ncbi:MAG: hypothetical protein HQ481_19285 [Alphaproteobacteria bacterium]|nr:hypothetical protein [Alphaproteobacteria bacterium]
MKDTDTAPRDALLDAALDMAAESGWSAVSIAAAAERAGIEPQAARRIARGRAELLVRLTERVDAAMLESLDADARDPDISVRDRLFEALMARLDALAAQRDGVRAILRGLPRDPLSAIAAAPALGRSMARVLDAIGQSAKPPFGPLKIKGLAVVWLATLRVWLGDDSDDMAATMKALDQNLARAEEMANSLLPGTRRRGRPADT